MSVSRKSLISSLLAGGLLVSLIGATPANAAPTIALSVNGVVISTAAVSTTPAIVSVPADDSIDAVDAIRFFLTDIDAGTTVTVAATNSFIVPSLSTTLNPVRSSAGLTSANYSIGAGTTFEFFAYTRMTALGTITITNGGITNIYYLRGTAGPAHAIAFTPNVKPFTSTLVKQSVKITDIFANPVAGVTPTLALFFLTSTNPTASNANGVSEFSLTYPSVAGMSALSVSIPAVDIFGLAPAIKMISTFIDVIDANSEVAAAAAGVVAEKEARAADKIAAEAALATEVAARAADKIAAEAALATEVAARAADKIAAEAALATEVAARAADKIAAEAALATEVTSRAADKTAADLARAAEKVLADAARAADKVATDKALADEKAARAADKAIADAAVATEKAARVAGDATEEAARVADKAAADKALADEKAARVADKAATDKALADEKAARVADKAATDATRAAEKLVTDKALADEKAARLLDKTTNDRSIATLNARVAVLTKQISDLKALYNKLAVRFKQKQIK